jgi:hypothetical protein
MSATNRLAAARAGRYRIERELGVEDSAKQLNPRQRQSMGGDSTDSS